MPDETGTKTIRSDAPGVDDSLFGDAPDDATGTAAEKQDSKAETAQEPDGTVEMENAAEQPEGLKVVVSIKGSRATIGVQRPSSDPHIETFEDVDLPALAQEVPTVTERARARWEENPKHPAYERPTPPPKGRNRRQRGAAQNANAETQEGETQQQTLRLF